MQWRFTPKMCKTRDTEYLLRLWRFLSRQVRRVAEQMKNEMCWRVFQKCGGDNGPSAHEIHNLLHVSRMAAVLDPRMKNVDWASEEDAQK